MINKFVNGGDSLIPSLAVSDEVILVVLYTYHKDDLLYCL